MFEEEAKELVSMFGVDNPENTMGYILVLSALEQAYKKGEAAQPSVHPTPLTLFGMRVELANWLKHNQWFIRPSRRG